MLKLKLNHTPRDVKVLTDQLVDAVASYSGGSSASAFMEDVLQSENADAAQTSLGLSDLGKALVVSTDANAALNVLGVSDFGKSLLDDADTSSALSTLGVSTFAKSLLDDGNASTALTTLGVSTYAKTLLDDADASAALTTLGVSAFAKTLLDDTDAATARTTLGAMAKSEYDNRKQFRPYNHIHNGDFAIVNIGTSISSDAIGPADRWYSGNIGSTKVATQMLFSNGQTAVPGNPVAYARTVVTSVAGAANCVFLQYPIEYVQKLAGKKVTATFWAKANANRPIAACFTQFFGWATGSSAPVHGIGAKKFNLTTSWQKCQIVVVLPSIAGKTIGSDFNDTLDLKIWFDAGSNYTSRTAGLGQQSGTFDIAHVSVVEGDASDEEDPFFPHPFGAEEAELQRFYQFYSRTLISGYAPAGGMVYSNWPLTVTMRGTPSVYFYSTSYSNGSAVASNFVTAYHSRLQFKMTAAGSGYCQTGVEFYSNLFGHYDN